MEGSKIRLSSVAENQQPNPIMKVYTFTYGDGMISHAKMVKRIDLDLEESQQPTQFIFWVRDGNKVERLNIDTGTVQHVGYAPDTIIAFNVDTAYVR